MSYTTSTDIFCDKCNCWDSSVTTIGRKGKIRAWAKARKLGWKRIGADHHLCPKCAKDA